MPGKFQGITRSWHRGRVDEEYRKRFLELLGEFAGTGKLYGKLMDRLESFVDATDSRDTLYLTGLLSALQQNDFMPYTRRSAWPFRNTLFSNLFEDIGIRWYREFNELYRRLSKETKMGLVDLDDVANQWYWDENPPS